MQVPDIPDDEEERLATLHKLQILDTEAEYRFDRYTRLCKHVFKVRMAVISLVDQYRQWFKSKEGIDVSETPRDISFCGHAILGNEVFEIPNAKRDQRFSNNPIVEDGPHIRFYAGAPLIAPNGKKLGTLCILDRVERWLSDDEKVLLTDLASMVVDEMTGYLEQDSELMNRNGFRSVGARVLADARIQEQVDLLLFDISHHFKRGYDRHEPQHKAMVRGFGKLLREHLRGSRVMSHMGGGNFCALQTVDRNFDQLAAVKALSQAANEVLLQSDASDLSLPIFVGDIRFDPAKHDSIDALIREADALFFRRMQHAAYGM